MPQIERRLAALGLILPAPIKPPPGTVLLFPFVNIRGATAYVSGHGPLAPDGSLAGPLGRVGAEVTPEEAERLAGLTALAVLASLREALGGLDRITGWNRVFGMVNAAPDFMAHPRVINGFSRLILDVFGPLTGRHARSAVGLASLPFGIAVEVEAEVSIAA